MKTIDRNVRGLGSRPFAAFLLLGLLGLSFDLALNANGISTEQRLSAMVESPLLPTTALAAESAGETNNGNQNSSQTIEAKARLLFKNNEFSPIPRSWGEGLEKFGRFSE